MCCHQNWVRFCPEAKEIAWVDYVAAVEERLEENHKDLMSELLSLKQVGKVSNFYD